MLNGTERAILEWLGKSSLLKKRDVQTQCRQQFGQSADDSIRNLHDQGFIESVNPVGETCFVITKKGLKALGGE